MESEKTKMIVFFDGDCPICSKEVCYLKTKEKSKLVEFKDIAALDFDPGLFGKNKKELLSQIHAMMPDGSFIKGADVFRKLYFILGYKIFSRIISLPFIRQIIDFLYLVFAKYRLEIGRFIRKTN